MNSLTINQLIDEYQKADHEGKKWLKIVKTEEDSTLNSIATIHMNACTQIKNQIMHRVGKMIIQEGAEL